MHVKNFDLQKEVGTTKNIPHMPGKNILKCWFDGDLSIYHGRIRKTSP